jgi:hypothetical protein
MYKIKKIDDESYYKYCIVPMGNIARTGQWFLFGQPISNKRVYSSINVKCYSSLKEARKNL